MAIVKKILKRFVPNIIIKIKCGYETICRRNKLNSIKEALVRGNLVLPNCHLDYLSDYSRQFSKIVRKISLNTEGHYVYPFDSYVQRIYYRPNICSITVDFCTVLNSDLNELRNRIEASKDRSFRERELSVIASIEVVAQRISKSLEKSQTSRATVLRGYFQTMLYRKPRSLDEALQKILFYNGLFWQMDHWHIGLGRLDNILIDYYNHDVESKLISESEAKYMLRTFIQTLGKDTVAKSMGLIGDTGQYILLGGVGSDGINIDNRLTELFVEIMTELKIPDPKLILRVNNNTSELVWRKTLRCILTGIGSPLIMNEDSIMKRMINFGYSEEDVWNVGTSACWEPLIIGKSFDQNNPFPSAIAISPLNQILLGGKNYSSFEELYADYKLAYKNELEGVVKNVDFDCSPLFTLFFDDCITREKDYTTGGAIYSYHGTQVVSLPNTVNALLNIKRLVFEQKAFTLEDCKSAIENNFLGMDDFFILLTTTGKKFGTNDSEVVKLTNDLMSFTGQVVDNLRCNGEKVKVGFSSPNYIVQSNSFPATLDGRKNGDPFAVHISPISSKIDISEVLDFSSELKYRDNCINGNVVDFILPSSYIKQSDKLVKILRDASSKGFFELQLNVMDKATLIDAKTHPDKYPNLVVRVWGFSAYFNDLPEEYKDNLIRRAELYEVA